MQIRTRMLKINWVAWEYPGQNILQQNIHSNIAAKIHSSRKEGKNALQGIVITDTIIIRLMFSLL
jgi:hypothetical protein